MERTEIMGRVQTIFRDVFDTPSLTISDTTSAADIDDWDSLNHINLVSAIEQDLGVRFALGELQDLQNVGDMIALIASKKS